MQRERLFYRKVLLLAYICFTTDCDLVTHLTILISLLKPFVWSLDFGLASFAPPFKLKLNTDRFGVSHAFPLDYQGID